MSYPSIRIEGQIFSGELLQRLDQSDMPGQRPMDFGLAPDTKVKDEIARAWAASQSYWRAFKTKAITTTTSTSSAASTTSLTSETRNLWLIPFLTQLGYKPDFARKGEIINGKTFPISHRDDTRDGLPIQLLGFNDSLDKRRDDGSGPRMSPHALVQEYLNLTEHLYGIVANGRTLRLLRDSTRLVRQSFIEFDLERMFDEDIFADFAILFRLLHATRLPDKQAAAPTTLVERYHQDALDQGARIRDGLRDSVEDVLILLGTGFLKHPANDDLRKRLKTAATGENALTPKDYYQNLLRLVYRLLFLFVAEERGLLFPVKTAPRLRAIYLHQYSLGRLRRLAERPHLVDKSFSDHWQGLHSTFRLFEFDGPGEELGISPLGGNLFSAAALGPLADAALGNADLIHALGKLCFFVRPDRTRSAVNFGALATEELGSVYESLLELIPIVDGQAFSFSKAAGNERKTSGSYYTPDSLVQCLLESAIEPVMEVAIKGLTGTAAADAILKLRACDPACGSGHFLVSAAHRMARRIARLRANGDEPSPADFRRALREVVSHSIYGVDINPMAVELCKVSLWLEAMDPGKPLTFLDHHIQCGNSLLGATPGLMTRGIPDEVFEPIEGDDKKYCSQFKKQNKQERTGQMSLFAADNKPWEHLGNLAANMMNVDDLPDATPAEVRAKEERYADLVHSTGYESGRQLADAWCAAFVWKKCPSAAGGFDYPITNEIFRRIERNPHDAPKWMRDEIHRLAAQYNFFHWHIAFPEVFQPLKTIETKDSNGWKGGFDVILGNPPWERTAFEDFDFFATRDPDVLAADTTSLRKKRISQLETTRPQLFAEFVEARRSAEGENHFYIASAKFPKGASGRINTYALFTELAITSVSLNGLIGVIVQSSIATDAPMEDFWRYLITSRRLTSLVDFENKHGIFPAVHKEQKFCLLTIAGSSLPPDSPIRIGFWLTDVGQMSDPNRVFELTLDRLLIINVNTNQPPVCRTKRDFDLIYAIHSRCEVMRREGVGEAWAVAWRALMTAGSSGNFRTVEQISSGLHHDDGTIEFEAQIYVPLLEAKLIHQFDYSYATFAVTSLEMRQAGTPREITSAERTEHAQATPRFWALKRVVDKMYDDKEWQKDWILGIRDVTNVNNERTSIASALPRVGLIQPLNAISCRSAKDAAFVLGALNSMVLDYVARQKVAGRHLNITTFSQLPIPGMRHDD